MLYLVVFPQIFDRFMHFVARLLRSLFSTSSCHPHKLRTKLMGQRESPPSDAIYNKMPQNNVKATPPSAKSLSQIPVYVLAYAVS